MSKATLEQILEMLLNENNKEAEELLHEYVVNKARQEYERVLDESEDLEEGDEELDEMDHSDKSEDFRNDLSDDEDEIESDMYEEEDGEDDMEMDVEMEPGMDGDMEGDLEMDGDQEGDLDGEEDIEGKVSDLEDELESLKAEFEELLADNDGDGMVDGHDHAPIDDEMGMGDEMDADADEVDFDDEHMESVELDLDEAEDMDDSEDLEEATKFSDKVSEQPVKGAHGLKGSEPDNTKSPYSDAPKPTKNLRSDNITRIKDGGEGKKDYGSGVKDNPKDDTNMNYTRGGESKGKGKSHGKVYGSGHKKPDMGDKHSPMTKSPK